MKKILILVGVLLMFGFQTTEKNSEYLKTMMLRVSGKVEVLPDMAKFQVTLECLERNVKTSKKCLVEKSNDLNKKLLSFGIDQNDILTTAVNMHKSYKWVDKKRVFEGYKSSTTVIVTVKDLDALDEIYTELLEHRNLNLGGLSYAHSQMDDLKNEAYLKALQNANVLANKLVTELPETIAEVVKIGNVSITSSNPNPIQRQEKAQYMAMEADAGNQAIVISAGTITVQATLFVEYVFK